ncbi:MAG: DegT/DnrJ/EryC1/StrS family aminotransferase [Vicinamibacterales bacterium]
MSTATPERSGGPALAKYEQRLAALLGCRTVVAFSNARTGIACLLRALGAVPGDEVVLSPVTCKVIPLTVLSLGLVPRFVDVSTDTLNLDAGAVARAVGPRTRAILFQHTYGSSGGLQAVVAAARAAGVPVIEDRAQSMPGTGPALGGIAVVYSNNLLKPLPAGSGGLAATNDAALGARLAEVGGSLAAAPATGDRMLRISAWVHDHVLGPRLYWPMLTLYSRVDASYRSNPVEQEIETFITGAAHRPSPLMLKRGLASLARLADVSAIRAGHVAAYAAALAGVPGVTIPSVGDAQPLLYFPVRVRHKRELLERARKARVEMIPWPNQTPIYSVEDPERLHLYGYQRGSCPAAEQLASDLVGLPTHPGVTPAFRAEVVRLLQGAA